MLELSSVQKTGIILIVGSIELLILITSFLILHWSIAIIVEIILHYLALIKLVHDSFFPGGVMLITRYQCWKLGVTIAESFKGQLRELSVIINDFYNANKTLYNSNDLIAKYGVLNSIIDLIHSYLKLSETVNEMSSYQKNMIISLNKLKMSLDESKLSKYIEAAIAEMQNSKKKRIVDIKSIELDQHLNNILRNIGGIHIIIEEFLLQSGFIKNFYNYFFNDTFGSLKQLKCELKSRFNCESFKVPISTRVQLDCLLIKNSIERVNNDKKDTVMIICNRESSPYELFAYTDKWIEFYLSYGINVVLWNYRGYGESNGYATLSNIQSDADQLMRYITGKYSFTKVGVHGISLGGIPAAYLVNVQKVSFAFIDRSFMNINALVNNKLFNNAHVFRKVFFVDNVDVSQLLFNQKDPRVVKVISYDLKKDEIEDCISLKSGLAEKFYRSIDEYANVKTSLLENLLNETEKEYEAFENDLCYLINKINNQKDNDEKIELFSIQKDLHTSALLSNEIRYQSLNNEGNHNNNNNNNNEGVGSISFANDISIINEKVYSEGKMIQLVKSLFEKFDAAGETLLSLDNNNPKAFLNSFFINMLTWGSFKIGQVYATDKLIAYRAISKKFAFMNLKISKIISSPSKYKISDPGFSSALQSFHNALVKIETFFNQILFDKMAMNNYNCDYTLGNNPNNTTIIDNQTNTKTNINNNNNNNNDDVSSLRGDCSISMNQSTLNNSTCDSYRNAQISPFIKNSNIGNLLLLNCGHEGLFSVKELEMYSVNLLNSAYIN